MLRPCARQCWCACHSLPLQPRENRTRAPTATTTATARPTNDTRKPTLNPLTSCAPCRKHFPRAADRASASVQDPFGRPLQERVATLVPPPWATDDLEMTMKPGVVGVRKWATTYFGARIACDEVDFIQCMISRFGVWEPDVSHVIERNLGRGEVFIDIGANIGYDSLLAASLVGDAGAVVAVEPVRS